MTGEDVKIFGEEKSSGGAEMISSSKLLSLLASKDCDFLLSPTGTRVKICDLEGKIVGIYFSANWYPPCRKFTTVLANAYEQLKGRCDPGFEIVFVSCDEDMDAFDEYSAVMPWLSIPFSDLETKRSLNRRFDIEDLPCLIILQDKQDFAILDGVDLIYRHGSQAYPFTKERVLELLQNENDRHRNQTLVDLLTNLDRDFVSSHTTSKQLPVPSLEGKTIGLYFSALWCSPGVKFTPKLASIYHKINQEFTLHSDYKFEIVFVSSDSDESAFDSYFRTMPWTAIPYGDENIKNLAKYFDVQGIPSLVIIGADGKTVTKQGRKLINLFEENAYPFTEERIEVLQSQVNEESKNLPESEQHSGHRHELLLVSEGRGGGAFICCDCEEQGFGWAYQCIECGYQVHPKCVRSVVPTPS